MRRAELSRKTAESDITVMLTIEGRGTGRIESEIGFLNHMLATLAKHGRFDLEAVIKGDLEVDQHHLIEDTGIVLGSAFRKALGDLTDIARAGCFIHPMDETLALVALDISGRPYLKMEVDFQGDRIGDLETCVLEDFFQGFANGLKAALHIKVFYGRSDHHKVEAIFKALARSLHQACELKFGLQGVVPSTKGVI